MRFGVVDFRTQPTTPPRPTEDGAHNKTATQARHVCRANVQDFLVLEASAKVGMSFAEGHPRPMLAEAAERRSPHYNTTQST
jgi:hypothetical protein